MPLAIEKDQAVVTIREFEPGDELAFRLLNEEWIERFFRLEKKDIEVLSDPQGSILAKGGRIFFAVRDGELIGCCALVAMEPGEFEVAKMAVTPAARGGGLGRALLQHTIDAAREMGAARLYLESSDVLKPAIHLYEQLGFRRLPAKESPFARANVFMEMLFESPRRQ